MALDHEMNKLNLSLKNISRVDSNFSVNILKEKRTEPVLIILRKKFNIKSESRNNWELLYMEI